MDAEQAESELGDAELVACVTAPVAEAKNILDACLAAEIPVTAARDACCGKGGCGCSPKLQVLARPTDARRVVELLQERWRAMAESEGTLPPERLAAVVAAAATEEDPPCPACGTVAPLVAGACSDCGLQLE